MTRISENQLVLPSLFFMSLSSSKSVTTSELIPKLRDLLKPAGEDLKILSGRNDDKFSQIVRNLKAHNTFDKYNFAKYNKGIFTITKEGEEYLKNNLQIIKYLLVNDFKWEDLKGGLETIYKKTTEEKKIIEIFDESIMIQEGMKKIIETQVYERSIQLRNRAIQNYSRNGKIFCNTCGFNFDDFYGEKIGSCYIEIHHIKPIFKYEDEDLNKVITKAINNVIPICSNCHRMIHRVWKNPLKIAFLISQIKSNGIYNRI